MDLLAVESLLQELPLHIHCHSTCHIFNNHDVSEIQNYVDVSRLK